MCGKTRFIAFHFREFATLLGEAIGKPVQYDHITYQQFEEGMTKDGALQFMVSSSLSKLQKISSKFKKKKIYKKSIWKNSICMKRNNCNGSNLLQCFFLYFRLNYLVTCLTYWMSSTMWCGTRRLRIITRSLDSILSSWSSGACNMHSNFNDLTSCHNGTNRFMVDRNTINAIFCCKIV